MLQQCHATYNHAQSQACEEQNMAVTAPEWLTRRGGALKLASDGRTWYVLLSGEPQYAAVERPVAGRFGAFIKQVNSGKPIDSTSIADSPEGAVMAGLDDLRKSLGW
jgi:hypothetical protein